MSFVSKLLHIPPADKKAMQNLRQAIIDTPALAEKAWLLSQIDKKHINIITQATNYNFLPYR